jgi:hypothetical protein
MLAVLDGGMCAGMCEAIHSNNKCLDLLQSFMPCIASRYLRRRNATYFYKALIFSLLLSFALRQKKVKKTKISPAK